MKIFLVEVNEADWEQNKGYVIVAENKEKAIRYLKRKYVGRSCDWDSGYKIKEIVPENYKRTMLLLINNVGA